MVTLSNSQTAPSPYVKPFKGIAISAIYLPCMGIDLLINRRVVKKAAIIAGTLTAGSLLCTLFVMAFQPSNGEHVVLALSLAIIIPLVCATPVALVVASQSERLSQLNGQLAHDAAHDSLTELANRRTFFAALEENFDAGPSGAVLLIDADRFKLINDEHGHHTGDEALRALARLFSAEAPDDALVARLGGEEFGVLLHGASLSEARDVAEHLRKAVEQLDFCSPEGASCPFTISVGIDLLREEHERFPLKGADSALYTAKEDGRNRVAIFSPKRTPHPSEKAA